MTTPTENPFGDEGGLIDAMQRSRWVGDPMLGGLPQFVQRSTLPTADVGYRGRSVYIPGAAGVADAVYVCVKSAADTYSWVALPNTNSMPDLTAVDFLVGTATGLLSGEIAVGTAPGGELGGTWASPTVDSVHSGSKHTVILRASNTNEVTTTSTSAVDLLTFSSLSIPVTSGIIIKANARKTTGAAAYAALGVKLNSTVIVEADATTPRGCWLAQNVNQAQSGAFQYDIHPHGGADYVAPGTTLQWLNGGSIVLPTYVNGFFNGQRPSATITDIAIRAISGSGSVTVAVKEVAIYEVLWT